MTKRHLIEIDSVILFILAAGIGVAFAFYTGHKPQFTNKIYLPVMQYLQNPFTPPTITHPPIPQPQVTSQLSPDGTKQLTMMVTTNKDLSKTYTFATSDADGSNRQTIYTSTSITDSIGVPFNTWSPDNKYVFLERHTATGSEALIMKTNGQPITEGEKYFNVAALFTAKNTGNAYQETTGWASETLLIVNSTKQDGSRGPSYWFEVPSKAIIQLFTEF